MSSLGLEFSRWEGFLLNSASFGLIWPHYWSNALWIFCRMPCTTRFPHSSWRKHKLIPALCDLHKLLPLLWEVPVLVSGHFLIQCANQYLPDDSRGTLLNSVILCASLFPLMHFPMNLSYSDFFELWTPSPPLREIARPCLDSPIQFCGLKLYPGSTLGSH